MLKRMGIEPLVAEALIFITNASENKMSPEDIFPILKGRFDLSSEEAKKVFDMAFRIDNNLRGRGYYIAHYTNLKEESQ